MSFESADSAISRCSVSSIATQTDASSAYHLGEQLCISRLHVQTVPRCEGGFGRVFGGVYCGTAVDVKRIGDVDISIMREVAAFKRLSHPHLQMFYGIVILDGELHMVLSTLADAFSLDVYVKQRRATSTFEEEAVLYQRTSGPAPEPGKFVNLVAEHKLAMDMLKALTYMHNLRPARVHGELQPSVVSVEMAGTKTVKAKLHDYFGFRTMLKSRSFYDAVHNDWFDAPELADAGPSINTDAFAFGCLVMFMGRGMMPDTRYCRQDAEGLFTSFPRNTLQAHLARSAAVVLCQNPADRAELARVYAALQQNWRLMPSQPGCLDDEPLPPPFGQDFEPMEQVLASMFSKGSTRLSL
eukprot:TRINITY_DN10103_c0_g1_i4.p1 TRINITY_DN10103_c0_g1~~TRINITY_DN10103_c0_g1_i4.p1  ORF type:complete len:355 (+),score=52.72 TRINITY_DN10103_c0_g1_i4:159-1223(+)